MILSPTSQIGHHHKVTNITMSPTSLSPFEQFASFGLYHSFLEKGLNFLIFSKKHDIQVKIGWVGAGKFSPVLHQG